MQQKKSFIKFQISTTLFLSFHLVIGGQSTWETIASSHKNSRQIQFPHTKCSHKNGLKYLSGDALTDDINCIGPDNMPYPTSAINRMYSNWNGDAPGSSRRGRQSKQFTSTMDPSLTQQALLSAYKAANDEDIANVKHRYSKNFTFI